MYTLSMDLPDYASTEAVAFELERAARQLRQTSSLRAAHSMVLHGGGCTIKHGVTRTSRDGHARPNPGETRACASRCGWLPPA
jgi:hypothetical protein